jgi:hypothetical protein
VPVKRLNYFTHQFLTERDFNEEQAYHLEMRRRHNRFLHTWGVVEGLQVEKGENREVMVTPGFAIDTQGREIVLGEVTHREVRQLGSDTDVYVAVSYRELFEEADHHKAAGADGYTRVTEQAEVYIGRQPPPEDRSAVLLARLLLDSGGNIASIDTAVRKRAGAILADGSVTDAKLDPGLRSGLQTRGWVRQSFKPVRLYPVRVGGRLVRPSTTEAEVTEFIIDITSAYCDERGAKGTMGITVPAGATAIKGFRIAGETEGKVTVELFRTGWSVTKNKGEDQKLFTEVIEGAGSFHRHVRIRNGSLNAECDAVALSVEAQAKTEIWLVAAEFE